MNQPDLFSYPQRSGWKEPTTSKDAADRIEATGKAKSLRARVLSLFVRGSELTADECAVLLKESPFSVRPRLTELNRLGLIIQTGQRKPSSTGTSSHVWRLVRR